MFNLDSIELDFDDDFSFNIFSREVNSDTKHEEEKSKACDKIQTNHKSSNCEVIRSVNEQTNSGSSLSSNLFLNLDDPINIPRENNLKRPVVQEEKPKKKKLSHEGLLQRRFPGPAGLLPDKPFKEISDFSLLMDKPWDDEDDDKEIEKPIMYSQCSGSVFLDSGYQKLVTDFNLNDSNNPLNKYTVEWVKKTALNKGLQGRKIPFLGLVVHLVNRSMPDPVLILRDPTGEISGSLHREVWAEMGGKLRAGIALALRQVGVLITGVVRRQIYLNITMNNILALYSPSENKREIEITTVNQASKSDLCKSFEEWLSEPSRNAPAKPPPKSFPFTTVNDSILPQKKKEEIKNLKNKLQHFVNGDMGSGKSEDEGLQSLGIVLSDNDFAEEMSVPAIDSAPKKKKRCVEQMPVSVGTSNQVLSQEDSLIFEEFLSGINLDEFEK